MHTPSSGETYPNKRDAKDNAIEHAFNKLQSDYVFEIHNVNYFQLQYYKENFNKLEANYGHLLRENKLLK